MLIALNHLDEKDEVLNKYEKVSYGCFVILIIADYILGRDNYTGKVIYHLILFVGMLIYFFLSKKIPQGKTSNVLSSLGGVSFFVFAVHEMFVNPMQDAVECFIGKGSLSYMIVFLTVTILSLLTSLACRKFTPMVFRALSGNR